MPVVTGEASPYYLFHPHAPARAARIAPDARLIVMLREPAARALSHHSHEVAGGFEPITSFEDALDAEPTRVAPEEECLLRDESYVSFAHQHLSYRARGRYAEQLQRWRAHYPADRMLVISSERFYADPADEFSRVVRFLGLDPGPPSTLEFRPYNAHSYERMAPSTKDRLTDEFTPLNDDLFAMLDDDLGWTR